MKIRALIANQKNKVLMHDVGSFADEHEIPLEKMKKLVRNMASIFGISEWIAFQETEEAL